MNAFQRTQLMRMAKDESAKKINRNKIVYCLIKNGTNLGKITTDRKIVDVLIQSENFSILGSWLNNEINRGY